MIEELDSFKSVLRFVDRADEAFDLVQRIPGAIRHKAPYMAARAARWHDSDPNVEKCSREADDDFDVYRLVFTEDQRMTLRAQYWRARGLDRRPRDDDGVDESTDFIETIETYANAYDYWRASQPGPQKNRQRAIESVANALERLDSALAALDSAALGFVHANIVDAGARHGFEIYESADLLASMLNEPLRAQVEGGELRKSLLARLAVVIDATREAKTNLPKHDHAANDWRLVGAAIPLKTLCMDHGIKFETTQRGFTAEVLRALFDLAGVDVKQVSYWLKKAAEDPRITPWV